MQHKYAPKIVKLYNFSPETTKILIKGTSRPHNFVKGSKS